MDNPIVACSQISCSWDQDENINKAEKIIRDAYSKNDADELIIEIIRDKESSIESESIFQKKYSFILTLAFLVAAFNQFSGINAFLYYAPRIFEEGGLGQSAALLNSVGIGLTNVIFTFIGINLIDKLGRKVLICQHMLLLKADL